MSMEKTTTSGGYVFDNAGSESVQRFEALPSVYDPSTIRHLTARRVGRGWCCLEVGGGGGTVAAWLAERVGPTGHVLVTDIDTRFLDGLNGPTVEVRRHDIANDPLPECAFDLVHARLVLVHVPERARAVERLVASLKPGGWLVIEEFDSLSMPGDPDFGESEVIVKAHDAMEQVMLSRGVDLLFGRRLTHLFRRYRLADIGSEAHVFHWRGGSAGAQLIRTGLMQLAAAIVDGGAITGDELDAALEALNNPEATVLSPIMWSVWGRRS